MSSVLLPSAATMVTALTLASCTGSGAPPARPAVQGRPPLSSPAPATTRRAGDLPDRVSSGQAIRVAAEQVGLRRYDPAGVKVVALRLGTESIPFLADAMPGRNTWRVEFNNVDLARDTGSAKLANGHITRLFVTLAPDAGHVMKVTSPWPREVPPIAPYPPRREEEAQMLASATRYTALPQRPPGVTLLDCLASDEFMHWGRDVKQ